MTDGVKELRKNLDRIKARYLRSTGQVLRERQELKRAKELFKLTKEVQELIQQVAQQVQNDAHKCIASVATKCLHAIFDDPYDLSIVFERKRGKTEARLRFTRRELELDPESQQAGAIIDVAAFACRIAKIIFSKPSIRRLVVLDEPWRFLDEDNSTRVAAMMKTLAIELDIQFVIITHNRKLMVGKVIDLDTT